MLTAFKRTTFALLSLVLCLSSRAQLQITNQSNATALAQKLVGTGITISNVTLTGSPLATGFFRNLGGTQIGLDSGIVLSTGQVKTVGTVYGMDGAQTNFASTTLNTNGDPQLEALVSGTVSYDAAILEFDFVPIGDTVKFRYVFGSEEYPTFACSNYNDVFAFFLSGPGITGTKNIALIPGTNIPVAINSINLGTSANLPTCQAMGPGSPFTQYFIENTNNANFTYNGHTTVLTASSVVVPCQTYHLKLAITDLFDHIYDSGVFIEAQSLISTPLKIINSNPTANGVPYIVEGCTAGSIKVTRQRKQNFAQTINLFYGGTAVNGTDVQLMPSSVVIPANDSIVTVPIVPIADNITEGTETFKIYVSYGGCAAGTFLADSISIDIKDQMTASTVVLPSSCQTPTGSATLNVPAGTGTAPYQYALNGGTFQAGNTFSNLAAGNYILTVRDATGCSFNTTTSIALNNTVSVVALPADTTICSGASFTPRVSSSSGASYSWTPTVGVSPVTALQPVLSPLNNTKYIVTASLGQCSTTDTINVTVFKSTPVNAGPDLTIINGDVVQLQATGTAGSTYAWTPPAGLSATNVLRPMASPTKTTTYTLKQITGQGCTSTDDVTVTVLNCIDPMNAFTPNGDGVNDVWLVTNSNCLKSARVEVFNRYGARVYENQNYSNNWDGTYNGKPLADGTYYYIISYTLINGKPAQLKGNVTILR